MSGEAGGVVIGGIALICFAPQILAGLAIAGLTAGAIAAGAYLTNHTKKYLEEQKHEKSLVVNQCSMQLNSVYTQMQNVVREQTKIQADYSNEVASRLNKMGEELKNLDTSSVSFEKVDAQLANARKNIINTLGAESEKVRTEIIAKGKKELQKCIEAIEKSNREKDELVQWENTTAAAEGMQKASAQEMMRDADASVKMLKSMAESSGDETFKTQVENIERTLNRAKGFFEQQMYQSAFSNARTIIRSSAVLASEHVQEELEKDMIAMELRAKTVCLLEEMKARRYFEFINETRSDKKKVKADLYNFSQGKYKMMVESLEKELEFLDSPALSRTSSYEIQKKIDEFDSTAEPEARRIIERSLNVMQGYYERLHVLEVVADFMTQQDYKMDWAMPVGGDASQKLVVHFSQIKTGNTISVTLDSDAASGDIANMAMEILTFYGNGREVTEAEKKQLRDDLTAALKKAGLMGNLGCQGNINQPSGQTQLNDKESVKNSPVKPII